MVFFPTWDAGEEEDGEVIITSVGEGEGFLVPCQTGLREGSPFWVSLYFRMKFPSSKGGKEGNPIFL